MYARGEHHPLLEQFKQTWCRPIGEIEVLGSAFVSNAGEGVPAFANFCKWSAFSDLPAQGSSFRRDAGPSAWDGRAPRNSAAERSIDYPFIFYALAASRGNINARQPVWVEQPTAGRFLGCRRPEPRES